MGALNCDPHPGNYLFVPGGVAFLDFGCVRRFEADFTALWRSMVRRALERNQAAFARDVIQMGLTGADAAFDFEAHYTQYLSLIRPWLTEGPTAFTPEFVRSSYRALLVENPNRTRLRLPRALLFANRLQWGLYSVMARLGSTCALRTEILDILYDGGEARPAPFGDLELQQYLRDPTGRTQIPRGFGFGP